ncbi:MAG TPA: hypothetical protein VNT42_06675 [Sphingomonas sp.]|nr:hypothetical protein [Sphingomonas sp.]
MSAFSRGAVDIISRNAHENPDCPEAIRRVPTALREGGERFEGLLLPVVMEPVFSIRRPASLPLALADYAASRSGAASNAIVRI